MLLQGLNMLTNDTSIENALDLSALRMLIEAGMAEIGRGDFVELDDAELEDYLRALASADDGPAR